MSVNILTGDAREVLRTLPDASVQCALTSPPYYGLRTYLPSDHSDKAREIGLELTPDEFVANLVTVFREVRRVLRDDGTLWLNLGDTANNRRRIRSTSHQPSLNGFREGSWADATKAGLTRLSVTTGGLKEKDMLGIPWMLAFALRADGWYLRQEIIWAKAFGKPEPSRDRLPSRHETIFLLTKSRAYRLNRDELPRWASGSVWSVPPTGRSDHGAAFPEAIPEACIKAGSRPGDTVLDPFFGAGTTGLVADRLGRNCVGVELSAEYADLARERINADGGLFAGAAE